MNIKGITKSIKELFDSPKVALFIVVAIVVIVLLGIGWNIIAPSNKEEEASAFKNFGSREIEKDGVRTTVSEYLQGDGIVCLGNKIREKGDFNVLFVGNSEDMWQPVGFDVPTEGRLCLVLSAAGKVVDVFSGWNPVGFEYALDYLVGNRVYSLEKVRTVYGVYEKQFSSIDEDYLFPVCSEDDPRDNSCVLPSEFPEYTTADLDADEEVVVMKFFGETRVYPIKTLSVYPIILDEVGGFYYVVTYDWLTDKVSVFKVMINGERTAIGFVGQVYNSNILIYDFLTETWWQQFDGEGVLGAAAGYRLENLAYERATWEEASKIEGVQVVKLDSGEATEDNLLGRIEEYQADDRLHYIVSKKVENPKSKKTWGEFESSYKFGYVLFNDD